MWLYTALYCSRVPLLVTSESYMCFRILSGVSQPASTSEPEVKPSRVMTPSCGDFVNSKK